MTRRFHLITGLGAAACGATLMFAARRFSFNLPSRKPKLDPLPDAPSPQIQMPATPVTADSTLHTIAGLNQAISGSLDIDTTLFAIFTAIQQLLPADRIHINLYDPANGSLVLYTRAGDTADPESVVLRGPRPAADCGLSGWLITRQQPFLLQDTAADALPAPSDLQADGMRSILAMPIAAGRDPVGTLELGSLSPGRFDSSSLDLLQVIAAQADVALRNASLYQVEQKRTAELSALALLTQTIGTLDNLKDLFQRLAEYIAPLAGINTVGFLIAYPEENTLDCQAVYQFFDGASVVLPCDPLQGLPPAALLAQDVLISEDAASDPQWEVLGFAPLARRLELHEAILAPLVSGGQPLGYLLAASHTNPGCGFTKDQVRLLLIIASQAAPIILNTRLVEQSRQRVKSAEALRRIAALAASEAGLDEVLAASMAELARLTGSEAAALLLMDANQACLTLHPSSITGEDIVLETWLKEIHARDPLFNTTVTLTRRPLVFNGLDEHNPDYQVYLPLLRSLQVCSGMIVPLVSRDQGAGELIVARRGLQAYNSADIQLVSTAGAQLAGVVERARLFTQTDESLRRRVEQLTALTAITRELNTSLDPVHLLQLVYDEALRTTGAACGSILLLDLNEAHLPGRFSVQYSVGDAHSPELSELEEYVARNRSTFNVADFSVTPWLPGHLGAASALLVPISYREEVAGLIHLHSPSTGHFDTTAAEITSALAVQASSVLNNAVQYQEQIRRGKILDRQAQTLEYLADTVDALRRDQPLEEALAAVCSAVRETTLFQVVLVSLYQPADGTLRRVYAEGIPAEMWEELRVHTHPWRSVLQMLQPQFRIHNSYFIPVEQEPHLPEDIHMLTVLPSTSRQEEDAWDPDDMLAVPLYSADGAPLGLISVDAPLDGRRPDRQTIETVEVFATQAAVAIENHWRKQALTSRLNDALTENEELYSGLQAETDRRRHEAAVQAETSRRMSTQPAPAVFENLLDSALQLLPGAKAGFVAAWDVKSLCLLPRVAHGYPDYPAILKIHYPVGSAEPGQSVLVQVFLTGQLHRFDQARTLDNYHFTPEYRDLYNQATGGQLPASSLFVPIKSGEGNLGVLVLDNFEKEAAFSRLDETLALSLTRQAALAIEKDRLYQAAEQRSNQLQALTQVAGALSFSTDLAVLVDSALDQLMVLVVYDRAEMWLASGSKFVLSSWRGHDINLPSPLISPASPEHPLILEAAQTGQAVLCGDTSQDPRFQQENAPPPSSWLAMPLFNKGEMTGLVTIQKTEPDYYTSEHIQLVTAFAGQIAIALENSRLFEETHRLTARLEQRVEERTAELCEQVSVNESLLKIMTELSASLDIDHVLARTLEQINAACGASLSAVLLKGQGILRLAARQSVLPPEPGPAARKISAFEYQVGEWVISRREALVLADSLQDSALGQTPGSEKARSLVAVPLLHGEETLGAFLLMHSMPGVFQDRQAGLAAAAGRQISVAIKNSEIYALIRDQAENLGSLLRIQQIAANRSQAILEAVADGVIVTGETKRISFINSSAERLLNVKREQVLGLDTPAFIELLGKPSEDWGQAIQDWSANPAAPEPGASYQGRMTLAGGQVVGIHLSPVDWRGAHLGTVSILRDITAEVMIDRMKSDFVANVSHELRTPMTSIKGYVEILLMGAAGSLNEEQIRSLQTVQKNTNRLAMLVDDLLDVSRIEAGRVNLDLEALDLASLVEETAGEMRRRALDEGKVLDITFRAEPGLPHVRGDRQRLRQVLSNLASNAYNYTPPDGRISFRLSRQGDEILVELADTGIGVLPQNQAHLFDRFYRGDDPLVLASPGTGLGLSIVKSLVEMHRGRIWLTSSGKRGEGTRFFFSLPADKG